MLFKAASAQLIVRVGLFGVYRVGGLAHIFLIVGPRLLAPAVLKAREAAIRRPESRNTD
jgi:hypothetical protein